MLKFGMNKCNNLLFQAFFSEFDYVDSFRIYVVIFCVIWKKSYCILFWAKKFLTAFYTGRGSLATPSPMRDRDRGKLMPFDSSEWSFLGVPPNYIWGFLWHSLSLRLLYLLNVRIEVLFFRWIWFVHFFFVYQTYCTT